jgi:hypothetical protein
MKYDLLSVLMELHFENLMHIIIQIPDALITSVNKNDFPFYLK